MNSIKRFLWSVGLAKYPTTNLTRLEEAREDYKAAMKLVAELQSKLDAAGISKKVTRRRKPAKKTV